MRKKITDQDRMARFRKICAKRWKKEWKRPKAAPKTPEEKSAEQARITESIIKSILTAPRCDIHEGRPKRAHRKKCRRLCAPTDLPDIELRDDGDDE